MSQKLKTNPKFKKLQRIRDKLQKIAFTLKFEMQVKFVKDDLNILSISLNITASLKLNLQCPFPLFDSNTDPK